MGPWGKEVQRGVVGVVVVVVMVEGMRWRWRVRTVTVVLEAAGVQGECANKGDRRMASQKTAASNPNS